MKKLLEAVKADYAARVESAMKNYHEYLTELQAARVDSGRFPAEHYRANIERKISRDDLDKLTAALNDEREINFISVYVNWRRGSMGANQAKAEVRVYYRDNTVSTYTSERTGGCGYDKESTATGQTFRQCDALMKMLYELEEKRLATDKTREEFIGYGSGWKCALLPTFSCGVGFNCHRAILKKLGFEFRHDHSTKNSDFYTFTRKEATA